MDEGITDSEGRFELSGKETEMTPIEPKLNVYHGRLLLNCSSFKEFLDCNDEAYPCLKKFSIDLPEDYISDGAIPKKTFDAGVINISGKFSGEERDCIN